jgi:hypothetical protein
MDICSSKYDIRSIVPLNTEMIISENYIRDSNNLTKRHIKRTRSKIIGEKELMPLKNYNKFG